SRGGPQVRRTHMASGRKNRPIVRRRLGLELLEDRLLLSVTINVDAASNRHAINPNVYGVAFASREALADLNVPLHRSGGNATSRYNWQINGPSRASDWYFESIAEPSAIAGEAGDTFIGASQAAGATPMLTIPTIGWVAKLGSNRNKLASFLISRYG